MSFVVKNTTKWGLLDLVCPHTCRGCGELGAVLCERCKKNIIQEWVDFCPTCKKIVAESEEKGGNIERGLRGGLERHEGCNSPLERCWVVGWREGALEKVVKDFKYKSVRVAGRVLAEMVDEILPNELWSKELGEVAVVPLPTIGRHVRARGLDHTKVLAKELCKRRGWELASVLGRAKDTVQVGVSAAQRKTQAEEAYTLTKDLTSGKTYLLVDDIWTTGATMQAAAKVMREAGAERVYGVVLAVARATEEKTTP